MSEQTHPDDDSYIVRVKAVVMTRDDSTGGWVLQEGGGLSRVGVVKVMPAELPGRNDFLIYGERLRDKRVILQCFLKKDLTYVKATPIFHHWKVGDRKCGLTFQSPADARAFDRGVRKAIEDLTEGSTTSSSTTQNEAELGDDDVFTGPADGSFSFTHREEDSPASQHHCLLGHLHDSPHSSPHYFLDQQPQRFHRHVTFCDEDEEEIVRINPRERSWLTTGYEDYRYAVPREDADPYVHLGKGHPPKDAGRGEGKAGGRQGVPARCVYCRDVFSPCENGRGRCQDAPDAARTCIRRASCMWCADSLLYHCLSDPEGDYSDPCSCESGDERFCLRWLLLAGLALLLPCMCCYLPLRACYRCGVACRCCGGKHKAVGGGQRDL